MVQKAAYRKSKKELIRIYENGKDERKNYRLLIGYSHEFIFTSNTENPPKKRGKKIKTTNKGQTEPK